MKILVTGFGPFGTVRDNPASRLARGISSSEPGLEVVGHEIPVSYERAIHATLELVARHQPTAILGVGVAVNRTEAMLEARGRAECGAQPDIDGCVSQRLNGPEEVCATLDVERWSRALQCAVSSDAGSYVCNAWLHQVAQAVRAPVGFLHIPPRGVSPTWLLGGLRRLVTHEGSRVG